MPDRLLQLEDIRNAQNPEKIAVLFRKLGYNASAEPLPIDALELPSGSASFSYLSIANLTNSEKTNSKT